MATINRFMPAHPAHASKGDLLQAGKAIHDKLRSELEQRLAEAEARLQASQDEVRQFVGRMVREGLEGQGKAFKAFMVQELLSTRSWCQDSLLRHEAKALALKDHTDSSLDRLHDEFQKGLSSEDIDARVSQRFDEELAARAEEIQRRCEESVRGIYERNASALHETYQDNLGYIRRSEEQAGKRLEDGLGKGLSYLEMTCHEKIAHAEKSFQDRADHIKYLEEYLQKRFEEELAVAMKRLEARGNEQADFLARSHQESMALISSLLEHLSMPAPVVQNTVNLPDALPPEVVVNVPPPPPPRLLAKIISYDDMGRPWKTEEQEMEKPQ